MPLQFQQFPFLFQGGLNSKTDSFQLPAPSLLQADNVRFQTSGAISKRTGFENLTKNILGGSTLSSGVAIQVFNDELLAFDGTYIYSYLESLDFWVNRGLAISVITDQRKIINTRIAQQSNPDGVSCNGLELYVWEDNRPNGAGVRYTIIDSRTGASVTNDQLLYQLAAHPKVAVSGDYFSIFFLPGKGALYQALINTNTPAQVEIINLTPDTNFSPNFYLPYDIYTGPTGLIQISFLIGDELILTQGGPITGTIRFSPIGNCSVVSCILDSQNQVWSAFVVTQKAIADGALGTGLYLACNALDGTTILAPLLITALTNINNVALIEDLNPGSCNMTYEVTNSPDNYLINLICSNLGKISNFQQENGNITNYQFIRGLGLASKPFQYNNQLFINTVYQSINQSTYFTLCLTQNFKCISKINPGVGGGYRTNQLLSECQPFSDQPSQFLFTNQKKGVFVTNDNTTYSLLGVNASYLDFNNINAFNSAVGANNLHIVGGIEKIYDGVSVVEDNFHLYPETIDGYGNSVGCNITLSPNDGYLSQGQYQYSICYEWTDAFNQVQRGQPSVPVTVDGYDGYAALLSIPTLRITDKLDTRTPVCLSIFRTVLVAGVPSSVFYKVTSDLNPLANDPTQDVVTYLDTSSDLDIQANEPLYTVSQIYNSAPPACSLISSYQTRLFLSGLEDPNVIWTSQNRFELDNYNTTPIEFSPLLVEGMQEEDGQITAIAVLDQAMIVFKENSLYYFNGDGPNANGTAGAFSNVIPIPSSSGCINANSIISIPPNQYNSGGLMYQSNKGIYLLDRAYNNTYIGNQVEQYNGLHITSAEVLKEQNEVVFTSLEGTCLVYNYFFNVWTTWSYLPAIDSCIWNGQLTMIRSDGQILTQVDNYYADFSNNQNVDGYFTKPIVRTVQLPWLSFSGLQGYQSVPYCVLLGHYNSPHTLNMSVMYNFDPAPKEPVSISSSFVSNTWGGLTTFGAGINFGGGFFTPYQFQYNFGYPWCQSLSLLITDDPTSTSYQSSIWSAITFQVGVFSDPVRLPAQNKFSGNKVPNGR